MLSLETRINGRLISCAYVVNTLEEINGKTVYSVEYHRLGKKPPVMEFYIFHDPKDGAEDLVLLIHDKLFEELKKG